MPNFRTPHATPEEGTGKLHDLLSTLWFRNRELIDGRLDVLRSTHRALRADRGDQQARKNGTDAAHKLAGILGTFGLPKGTELTQQLDEILGAEAPLRPFDLDFLQHSIDELETMIEAKSKDAGKRRS